MGDTDMTMGAALRTDVNGNILTNIEEESWTIAMVPINKSFFVKSGTINVTNISYTGLPQTGFAAFKLEFEGQFHQNIDENDLYKISGTIVANLPGL